MIDLIKQQPVKYFYHFEISNISIVSFERVSAEQQQIRSRESRLVLKLVIFDLVRRDSRTEQLLSEVFKASACVSNYVIFDNFKHNPFVNPIKE